ncbi:MAG: acyl-ACP--UDP-N-acetylglucosamine O-acyltransferase [Ignavibacteria bacterium]|nr:acyl-ACP--UDP-N-acetylglucosamine O-acyltransferase [Ignavibacteria bacterium]
MKPKHHPSAIISKNALIDENVTIGPYVIIEDDVIISSGTEILAYSYISKGTKIGKNCLIFQGVVIGTKPQDLKYDNSPTNVIIGDNNEIREYVTIHRGTQSTYCTKIGNNNFLMAYSHIAHDCKMGDNNILANAVQLGGHVQVEDWVVMGGVVKVHQFCRIGCHSMIGGDVKVTKDVAPYTLIGENPPKVDSINKIGLRRRGFPDETINEINKFYKILLRSGLNNTDGIKKYLELNNNNILPEIRHCIEFIQSSQRGIYR